MPGMPLPESVRDIDLNKVSFQVYSDDTNLDAYSPNEMWTRDPSDTNQVWKITKVGEAGGEDVYTITNVDPTNPAFRNKNIEAIGGDGSKLKLAEPNSQKLSQQWLLHGAEDRSTIVSRKNQRLVFTANGIDSSLTLTELKPNAENQEWTLYNKQL
ncbi:hypothetical protein ACT1U9_14405 [Streptomyces sp. BR1]|uniref:hypothetical protein n=1 Tax=Streptomyces sp. BR1 TaxID=1592323 RepID=UPI00402B49E4